MLLNLHVKNIALIKEVDLDFSDGLNILSGETGAGKSLLLGSLNIALGSRMPLDLIRHGESEAFVELVFSISDKKTEEQLASMGIEPEDGTLIISRRVIKGKTVSRMNGAAVTASDIRKAAALLLDIHGQHENQSLLNNDKQLAIIDAFGGGKVSRELARTDELYKKFRKIRSELAEYDMDEASRLREESLLEYELGEIRAADISEGEEEQLEALYRKMVNSRKIIETCETLRASLGDDNGASDMVGRAIRDLSEVIDFDQSLSGIYDTLSEIESLLSDVNRETSSYMDELQFSESDFADTENRLDLIRSLMAKYGKTYEKIKEYEAEAEARLDFLKEYEQKKQELSALLRTAETELEKACSDLSSARKAAAAAFSESVQTELKDLNFTKVEFDVSFKQSDSFRADGYDIITFEISLNPGEPLRPLSKVASGGELSRIMLAIRTLLADKDSTETLIFDEIDTGISGLTAQKVAEKMAAISRNHQLLCVTHLAQIASMADSNYLIEKESDNDSTWTRVRPLAKDETVNEISRLLGGTEGKDTAAVYAADMIERASSFKSSLI